MTFEKRPYGGKGARLAIISAGAKVLGQEFGISKNARR